MGESFRHKCGACGYEAEVSGGDDLGFVSVTTTIVCRECRELSDAVLGRWEPGRDGVLDARPPACRADASHKVERWRSGDPCPRCGRPIPRGELTLDWD